MAVLLNRLANQRVAVRYVGQLLAAFRDEEIGTIQTAPDDQTVAPLSLINQPLDEPLANRELEILSLPGATAAQQGDCRKAFHFPGDRKTTHDQHLR
jgi:hypothetical protein